VEVKNNVMLRIGSEVRTTVVICIRRMNETILMYNKANLFETKWKTFFFLGATAYSLGLPP
jgi:hypothetical protein